MPEPQLDATLGDGLPHPPHERLQQRRSGAPDDVEPRHRVPVPVREVAAALGPADDREEADAQPVQPGPLLAAREVDVGGGPLARPVVLARGVVDAAVERGAAEPVLHGEVERIADAHAALLRRVDEEEPAERPERLPAQRRLGLLIQNDDPAPRVGELGGGDEPREPGPDHDDVGVHGGDATRRRRRVPARSRS